MASTNERNTREHHFTCTNLFQKKMKQHKYLILKLEAMRISYEAIESSCLFDAKTSLLILETGE